MLVLLAIAAATTVVWLAGFTVDGQPGNPLQAAPGADEELLGRLAPQELAAHSGRGLIALYERDEEQERIESRPGDPESSFQEKFLPRTWVIVTGVINQKALHGELFRQFGSQALFVGPQYRRVALERQERLAGGNWSSWAVVDRGPTDRVLDDLPEQDGERTPDEIRSPALVDPLPMLKTGSWQGVDVPRLARVPKHVPQRGKDPLKGEPEELMIRVFDFAVKRGISYRYRARIVMEGAPGRARKTEWFSPWSTATGEVRTPIE